ncbi:protein kinase [Streptomyces sp. SBST2-5]|uniref:Protein kinase n=1 Tax=Streptomyces composti TaxID=2720025 RepID=A0ABX1A9P1_9ACTN|nr:protein kinase [Streptomyces composti]NJP50416.1 protein kinase [Streptomyces composti]
MEKLGPGDPQQIGAYRLLARLGAGGMGHVYLARSERGRTVAVKLVREELARQEEFRARFRQEVEAARQVGGHWTAPVLDADTEAAVPWVATGYVAGPSLQQVVGHDHGALPERSVRILAAGLAHALEDIHAAGMVHRDLKPSNVLVTIDGPRVIDFGIARALQTVTDGGLTRTGALVGSPGFMAPEQVRGDRITPACDIFCLGSVLAYAATGRLPFGTANSGVHALMFRIAQEEPDLEPVPEGLRDLIGDCLKKDPDARPGLDEILRRTGAEDTVADGRSRDPWLPSALVAQLGRHAVQLLDTENPEAPQAQADTGGPTPTAVSETPAGASPEGAAKDAPAASPSGAAPAATPEHAPADDDAAPPPPGEPGSGGPVNHLPTVVVGGPGGTTPPPGPAPGAPGHPQQHPQPAAYGYPYGGYPSGATPPYGPPPYYGAPGGQDPRRDPRPSTALLVLIALVVALAAGGTVYALMSGGDKSNEADDPAAPPSTAVTAPDTAGATTPTTGPDASKRPSTTPPPSGGAIPTAYLGRWSTSFRNAMGEHTRRLTLQQGETGDTVLSLVADGPTGSGTYHCVFEAELTSASDDRVRLGPSTVTVGRPSSSCTPGSASEITLLPDGSLRRVHSGGELTFQRD